MCVWSGCESEVVSKVSPARGVAIVRDTLEERKIEDLCDMKYGTVEKGEIFHR